MRIETALRQTDEYGRVLTAKEAFRELCYHFHGKRPSQNRHLKRVKEYINDITCKKRLTSSNEIQRLGKIYEIQQRSQKTKQQQSTNINGIIFCEATEFLRG